MITNLTSVSLVLWLLLFNAAQQLDSDWPEHNNSTLLWPTLEGEKETEEACPLPCESSTRHLFSKESHRETVSTLSEPAVLKRRGESKRDTRTEKKIDNRSRRKEMVSRESSPSEP